jgi:predicted DNA-binding antitoxin AbrB/MazE fold protein
MKKYHVFKLVKSVDLPAGQYYSMQATEKQFESISEAESFISKEFLAKNPKEREELGYYWFPVKIDA